MLPYADAHFLPCSVRDRPLVVPEGSANLGLIGQYVEIPEDIVFTEEYSVRGARMAVYKLLGMKRYMIRFMQHTPGIEHLKGILHTKYNEYDPMIKPLKAWLLDKGVTIITDCTAYDLD